MPSTPSTTDDATWPTPHSVGDGDRLAIGPALRPTEHDERQRVVDPDQGMDETDADGRDDQDPDLLHRSGIIVGRDRETKTGIAPAW